jgi:hypothetical protein
MSRTEAVEERAIVSSSVLVEEREALERMAAEADRSLSAEIRRALRLHLARADEEER